MIGGGFHQDGVVIEMITLEAGETSMAEIPMEAVAMVEEMILRGGAISQVEHVIMADGT
jgi:hypothetical protein